ncbi:pre-rRNA-processing protein ESF1-like [Coffea arabica]|uniref:Pre-rRNA-processing protein ESF1-like n=1 Tax=Coffea arabica TaxID=13443 RepID=A0A6P6TKH3_COFAR|nr:pre-rRNA-processing protein ESF1-like [Coffea arabica]
MGSKGKNKKNMTKPDGDATANHRNDGKIITDARFASLHSDPRFREPPKHKAKVAIDSRFNRMFTDKDFATSKARTDKRGKQKKNDSAANSLRHYYRLEEEEEGAKERSLGKELVKNEESGESESEGVESDEESESVNVEKGSLKLENESETSDSEEEEEEEEEAESDDSMSTTSDSDEAYEEEEDTFGLEETVPEIDKETHRLAVVNMDWSQVKAVDLYVSLSSFLPRGGQIMSVAVYPSEFGLKRMEEEAIHGPVGLFEDDKKNNQNDEDEDDDDDEIDNEKLRTYELSRLRYYYAVVECDSIATADYLYRTCDGVEFERSSTMLDLRFVPDKMEFKHQPRDVAKHAPADYEGLDFQTRALQQSKIHLTWDDDEPQRAKTLKRKFNDDQLAELEFQEFLASDESDSDESENNDGMQNGSFVKQKKQDMYRALLQSGDGSDENDEKYQDMEVTFNTGLEDLSKRILEKKDRKSENVWDAILRERREKKKARKNRSKDSSEDESIDTDNEPAEETDDFFLEECSGKESKVSQGRNARKEQQNEDASREAEASRAELELLLADDKGADSGLKGYNLKRKKMKGKMGKEIPDEGKLPTIDYDDPRFSTLFTSPLFALDPTDPQFKRSAAYARQMANRQQKSESENNRVKEPSETLGQVLVSSKTQNDDNRELHRCLPPAKKEKLELSSLVRSIKMKSKQIPLHDKVLGKNRHLKIKASKSK